MTIGGRPYHDLADPLGTVGAALEATNFHPGRSGRDHLRVMAAATGIPDSRVDEMLELTGIPAFARRRAGAYSLGMRQRLALAAALLGDPQVLILDEPANGLDPEGIRWLRGFLARLSHEDGKTVLVSTHLLQEVENTHRRRGDHRQRPDDPARCDGGPARRADRARPHLRARPARRRPAGGR